MISTSELITVNYSGVSRYIGSNWHHLSFEATSKYVVLHWNELIRMYPIINNLSRWVNTQYYLHTHCTSGISQKSVLGPLLFAVYVSPIADITSGHEILFHQYADDTQLYIAANAKVDTADTLKNVTSCTHAVQNWFLLNDLLPWTNLRWWLLACEPRSNLPRWRPCGCCWYCINAQW